MGENQTLETRLVNIWGVKKADGRTLPFDISKIKTAIYKAFKAEADTKADSEGREVNEQELKTIETIAEETAPYVANNLLAMKKFGQFPKSHENIPSVEDVHAATIETLSQRGYESVARRFDSYHKRRQLDEEKGIVTKLVAGLDTTDKSLFVISESKERELIFDRTRIALALMREAGIEEDSAYSVAKETEIRIRKYIDMRSEARKNTNGHGNGPIRIRTSQIRIFANEVMEDLGIPRKLRETDVLTLPVYDYENIVNGKNTENANVLANSPEMVGATVAEQMSRQYMLNVVFSPKVAEAHFKGRIHLHDLGMGQRVYCSSHSPAAIAKFGLELANLSTTSKPAKHTHTLTGHLNTFLASMQAYYAGALGVAYINDIFAPYLDSDLERLRTDRKKFLNEIQEEMDKNIETLTAPGQEEYASSVREKIKKTFRELKEKDELDDDDIEKFLKQEAQYLIFSGSQMAFSRGGQTLFLDFNIHTGTPKHIKDNPAIGPGGKYYLRKGKDMKPLIEKINVVDNKQLSILYDGERKVMEERFMTKGTKKHLVRDYFLDENEKIDSYSDHSKTSMRFAKALLQVWEDGDGRGGVFPFPKCDLHVNKESFDDPEQLDILNYACEISSKNGSPYFIFDRESTTLSACCRLRTTIEDDYVLKKLESLRFCGMQNVTINAPQSAYMAGKLNRQGFIEKMKEGIELAIDAHIAKRDYIRSLGGKSGPQHQTQNIWKDGKPYVPLESATCILGLLGWNDAYQSMFDKELHEEYLDPKTGETKLVAEMALEDLSELYAYKERRVKETGLILKFEETPGESTCRRFAKLDMKNYKEQAKEVVKGSIEKDEIYYTNSVHFRADAPINLATRLKYQSKFHQLIEAGAIIHAFVGEQRPPKESIMNLVKWTWEDTQCAQVTISPEFTYCEDCNTISPGFRFIRDRKDNEELKILN